MGNNSFFREALSDFAFDAAYGDSIRHLYDSGYTPEQIREYLKAESLTTDRIQEVIDKYSGRNSDNTEDIDGNGKDIDNACDYEFVKEYDQYGRSTFVKRKRCKS